MSLQADLFRAHEESRADDARRRRINHIYCKWLDSLNPQDPIDNPYDFDLPDPNKGD